VKGAVGDEIKMMNMVILFDTLRYVPFRVLFSYALAHWQLRPWPNLSDCVYNYESLED
jgi:hypothetical protein